MDALEFSEQDRNELIEYYSSKLKDLESKVLHYNNLLIKLKGGTQIKAIPEGGLGEKVGEIISNIGGYSIESDDTAIKKQIPRQNWRRISINALKDLNAFSTTTDIYEFLIKQSPTFIQYDKTDIISKLSTSLSNLYSKKAIKRIKNTLGRGYFWALPVWFADDVIQVYRDKLVEQSGLDENSLFGDEGF